MLRRVGLEEIRGQGTDYTYSIVQSPKYQSCCINTEWKITVGSYRETEPRLSLLGDDTDCLYTYSGERAKGSVQVPVTATIHGAQSSRTKQLQHSQQHADGRILLHAVLAEGGTAVSTQFHRIKRTAVRCPHLA